MPPRHRESEKPREMSFVETAVRMIVLVVLLMAMVTGAAAVVGGLKAVSDPAAIRDMLGFGLIGVVVCIAVAALDRLFDRIGSFVARRKRQEPR